MHNFGAFEQCIVGGNAETLRHERRVRRAGFGAAMLIQGGLLVVLLVLPLLAPAALPSLRAVVPLPVFHSSPAPLPDRADSRPQAVNAVVYATTVSRPVAPTRRMATDFREPIDIAPGLEGNGDPLTSIGIGGPSQPTAPQPPRAAAPARAPVQMGGAVMEAQLIDRVQPQYPTFAHDAHISGAVVLSAIIARDGTIQSLRVVSGNALLTGAALQAVRQWRYRPTILNGQPVEVETLITVNFVLE